MTFPPSAPHVALNDGDPPTPLFAQKARRPDAITAVKVTGANLGAIRDHLVAAGYHVSDLSSTVLHGISRDNGVARVVVANCGDWIVEEYDYLRGQPVFRCATLDECVRYDLR